MPDCHDKLNREYFSESEYYGTNLYVELVSYFGELRVSLDLSSHPSNSIYFLGFLMMKAFSRIFLTILFWENFEKNGIFEKN